MHAMAQTEQPGAQEPKALRKKGVLALESEGL